MSNFRRVFLLAIVALPLAAQTPTPTPAPQATSQFIPARSWMARGQKLYNDVPIQESTSDCFILYNDGRIHIERDNEHYSRTGWFTGANWKIYEGRLADADLARVKAILEDPSFRSVDVRNGPNAGRADEQIQVWVPHAGTRTQYFFFINIDARRDYYKQLKPFLDWWHKLDKLKLEQKKGMKPTGCVAEDEQPK